MFALEARCACRYVARCASRYVARCASRYVAHCASRYVAHRCIGLDGRAAALAEAAAHADADGAWFSIAARVREQAKQWRVERPAEPDNGHGVSTSSADLARARGGAVTAGSHATAGSDPVGSGSDHRPGASPLAARLVRVRDGLSSDEVERRSGRRPDHALLPTRL